MLIVEVSPRFPRTQGAGDYRHALHVDGIDVLVRTEDGPTALPDVPASDLDEAIAGHAAAFIPDGATLQTMQLHESGKVTNAEKGLYPGVSIATFAMGSEALYRWLEDNTKVGFLPVGLVNAPEIIGRNNEMVTVNGAMSVDIHGQVVSDTRDGDQFSGVGGAEDFISGPGFSLSRRSLICLPSTVTVRGELRSRIVPWFEAGAVITTPRHQVDVIVTDYGAPELEGRR